MWQSSGGRQNAVPVVADRSLRKPFVSGLQTDSTKDHNGELVKIAWMSSEKHEKYERSFPPLPFQVYVLTSAKDTLEDDGFPTQFVEWIMDSPRFNGDEVDAHFEFYRSRFNNVLSCTAHQQNEIESRNRNAAWPRLITNWCRQPNWGVQGVILVIDRDCWKTNGVTLVHYGDWLYEVLLDAGVPDPHMGQKSIFWAERTYGPDHLGGRLMRVWSRAGGTWIQSALDGYNNGQASPALYPAVDPIAHHDVEHEDSQDGESDSDTSAGSESESHSGEPCHLRPEYLKIDMKDLMRSPEDIQGLKTTTYEGHSGWETTSVWKQALSKMRPPFAFTLYLASGSLPFAAEALFASLDRELLSGISWTLDIIRNIPDIQSALHHYSHEKRYRTPEMTARRLDWARMLVNKICAPLLPEELVQYIEDMLVPPSSCNHSSPPDRLFNDMFMYLDSSAPLRGPKIVYSNHVEDQMDLDVQRRRYPRLPILKLHVTDVGSWRLVSNELHIVGSLCIS